MKLWAPMLAVALVANLGACASRKPSADISDTRCTVMADALKTLRKGDPLPRVKEVLGQPQRTYRVTSTFGGRYDVMEYDTGLSPCARFLLDSPRSLRVMFDTNGQLASFGRTSFLPLQGATSVRVQGGAVSGF